MYILEIYSNVSLGYLSFKGFIHRTNLTNKKQQDAFVLLYSFQFKFKKTKNENIPIEHYKTKREKKLKTRNLD